MSDKTQSYFKSTDNTAQLFEIKNGLSISEEQTDELQGSHITDVDELSIWVDTGGFTDVRVERLENLEIDSVEVYYRTLNSNNETVEVEGIPGQLIGKSLKLPDTFFRVHYFSDSNVTRTKDFDIDPNNLSNFKLRRRSESSFISDLNIKSDTCEIEATFVDGRTSVAKKVIYPVTVSPEFTGIVGADWGNVTQYTSTLRDPSKLVLSLSFSDGSIIRVPYNTEDPRFVMSMDRDYWVVDNIRKFETGSIMPCIITCTYKNTANGYKYEDISKEYWCSLPCGSDGDLVQIKRISHIKNVIISKVDSSINKEYYGGVPNWKVDSLTVVYNNGEEKDIDSNSEDFPSVSLHVAKNKTEDYSGFNWPTIEGPYSADFTLRVRYSEVDDLGLNEQGQGNIVSIFSNAKVVTVYARIQSASVLTNFPDQYENISFKGLDDFRFVVTYNNNTQVTRSLPSFSSLSFPSGYWDSINKKWTYPNSVSQDSASVRLSFVYNSLENQDSVTVSTNVTLYKKKISGATISEIPELDPSDDSIDLSSIVLNLEYNNGETSTGHPVKIVCNKSGAENNKIYPFDNVTVDFMDTTNLNKDYKVKSRIDSYKFFYGSGDNDFSLGSIKITRDYSELEVFDSNGNEYSFDSDRQIAASPVNIDGVNSVKITFSDDSTYTINNIGSAVDSKVSGLKNRFDIYLSKEVWTWSKEQTNKFYLQSIDQLSSSEETVTFQTMVQSFDLSLKNGHYLYQDDEIQPSLASDFIYSLVVKDEEGKDRTISSLEYSDLEEYDVIISCTYSNNKINDKYCWPNPLKDKDPTQELSDITELLGQEYPCDVSFICKQREIDEEVVTKEKELRFRRYCTKIMLNLEVSPIDPSVYYQENRIRGNKINKSSSSGNTSDFGDNPMVSFNNGLTNVVVSNYDTSASYFKTYALNNDIYNITNVWPKNGRIHLCYDEFNLVPDSHTNFNGAYHIEIQDEGIKQQALRIVAAVKKDNLIVAGSTIEKSDLTITITDLSGDTIPLTEEILNNITLSNNVSSFADSQIEVAVDYVDVSFGNRVSTSVIVPLQKKSCSISYFFYFGSPDSGTEPEELYTVSTSAQKSYDPSTQDQTIKCIINFDDSIVTSGSESLYSYSSMRAFSGNKDISDKVSYSLSNQEITIAANVEEAIVIKMYFSSNYLWDDYGHAYSYNNDKELTHVYSPSGSTGTYEIPTRDSSGNIKITTVLKGRMVFQSLTQLQKLIIPNDITRIDDDAFSRCSNLSEIKFKARNQMITIGDNSFGNCTRLMTLDFLECGDIREFFAMGIDDDHADGGDYLTDIKLTTWNNCNLHFIKINQSSFSKVVRIYYVDNGEVSEDGHKRWVTARCGGGWKVQFEFSHNDPRETWIRAIERIGTSIEGSLYDGSGVGDLVYYVRGQGDWADNKYTRTYKTYAKNDKSHAEKRPGEPLKLYDGGYDIRKACGIAVRSDRNANLWVNCYGLGWDDFTYKNVQDSGYRFTTNGYIYFNPNSPNSPQVDFIDDNVGSIGTNFTNWRMDADVNSCIYPNYRLSSTVLTPEDVEDILDVSKNGTRQRFNSVRSGTLLDCMIPAYYLYV